MEWVRPWWESYQVEATPSFVFANKLKALKADLKKWNETKFGHANVQKKQLLGGLRELDVLADSRSLSAKEKGKRELLTVDLGKVILIDEIYWRQKFRALWLKEGDTNSKFFYCLASSHQNTNTIGKLLINGVPSTSQDDIRDHIAQFYEQLYREDGYRRPYLDGIQFSAISDEDALWLERPFDETEIEIVV